jgi:hypothetical protein
MFQNVAEFRYVGVTVTNQISFIKKLGENYIWGMFYAIPILESFIFLLVT